LGSDDSSDRTVSAAAVAAARRMVDAAIRTKLCSVFGSLVDDLIRYLAHVSEWTDFRNAFCRLNLLKKTRVTVHFPLLNACSKSISGGTIVVSDVDVRKLSTMHRRFRDHLLECFAAVLARAKSNTAAPKLIFQTMALFRTGPDGTMVPAGQQQHDDDDDMEKSLQRKLLVDKGYPDSCCMFQTSYLVAEYKKLDMKDNAKAPIRDAVRQMKKMAPLLVCSSFQDLYNLAPPALKVSWSFGNSLSRGYSWILLRKETTQDDEFDNAAIAMLLTESGVFALCHGSKESAFSRSILIVFLLRLPDVQNRLSEKAPKELHPFDKT
jgi:hypothetical protein